MPDEDLEDLWARIRRTHWPDPSPAPPWEQGTDLAYLRDVLAYWVNGFDWRAQEQELNRFPQFRVELDGVRIHFVHVRSERPGAVPLILTHGWPSTFAEYLPLVPLLTDPAAHAIEGPPFDLVIPSLPGYAFSERPPGTAVTYRSTARLWHRLMTVLGYERYGAGGGDFGSGITTLMALDNPQPLIGIHLTNLELSPTIGPESAPLTDAERRYLEQVSHWDEWERGYSSEQSTKPQTLGYGLNDSPAGLAAWILEKWRSWSDCHGDLESRFTRDFLLTMLTVYWTTHSITPSLRDYYDNRRAQPELRAALSSRVLVPTAIAVFPHMFVPEGDPPREWAERLYNVQQWNRMPRGGHFAPAEEPELVARDIARFYPGLIG